MSEIKTDSVEAGEKQFSSKELLQYKIVQTVFHVIDLYTSDENKVPDLAHDSRFARGVKALEALLWAYTPEEIQKKINALNQKCYEESKPISDDKQKSVPNQKREIIVIENRFAAEILRLLLMVLVQSPIMQSSENVNVLSEDVSLDELISATRSETPPEPTT